MSETRKASSVNQAETLELVARALRDLRFGSIELTVHDGRVVQLERKEKVRLGERGEDPPRPAR